MFRRLGAAATALAFMAVVVFGITTPAHATGDDTSVTITASPGGVTLPTTITYTVMANVQPGSNTMSGTVRVTFPSTLGSFNVNHPSCTQTGLRQFDCDYTSIAAGTSQTWYMSATTQLLGTLNITTTAQQITSSPTDTNASNDAASHTCTTILSLIVLC